jgi:hypothetical protein
LPITPTPIGAEQEDRFAKMTVVGLSRSAVGVALSISTRAGKTRTGPGIGRAKAPRVTSQLAARAVQCMEHIGFSL